MEIRKSIVSVEEVVTDGGKPLASPIHRATAVVVVKNPFAGRFVDDLSPLFDVGFEIGAMFTKRLVDLYGAGAARILARAEACPAAGEPLPGLPQVLRAEIEQALDEEMALTLEDLLERRTRLLLFDARQGLDGVEAVAALAAARLGWSAARTAAEIGTYRQLAASLRVA